MKKSIETSEHYKWGDDCDGWHLLKSATLSVIQEKMPPGSRDQLHFHQHCQQLFYILCGEATFYLENEAVNILAGESIHVSAGAQHFIENSAAGVLEFLVISQPMAHGDRIVV